MGSLTINLSPDAVPQTTYVSARTATGNVTIKAVAVGKKFVLTRASVRGSADLTGTPHADIDIPLVSVVFSNPAIGAGESVVYGNGGSILFVGGNGADVTMNVTGTLTAGTITVHITGYEIDA